MLPTTIRPDQDLSAIDPKLAWSAWEATGQERWDARRVRHLMRRGGFGANPSEIKQLVDAGPAKAIDALLGKSKSQSLDAFEPSTACRLPTSSALSETSALINPSRTAPATTNPVTARAAVSGGAGFSEAGCEGKRVDLR